MADIKQDILSLSYSPSFEVQGMQEADINLSLPPRLRVHCHRVRHRDRRDRSLAQRHCQAL